MAPSPCFAYPTRPTPLASSLASRLLSLLSSTAATTLIALYLLAIALRRALHRPSGQAPRPMTPEEAQDAAPAPHSGLSEDDGIETTYYPPTDLWVDYLSDPFVHANCVHHLSRCLALDPARHDRRP